MAEERKRDEMEQVEEEELGFKPDAECIDIDAEDKSEGSDGELSGKDR
jgi:hypothetical protein